MCILILAMFRLKMFEVILKTRQVLKASQHCRLNICIKTAFVNLTNIFENIEATMMSFEGFTSP